MRRWMRGNGNAVNWSRSLTAAAMAVCGVLAISARTAAQEFEPQAAGKDAVKSFQAPAADLSFMGPVDVARFVVRPRELTTRPDFAPATKAVEAFMEASMFADHRSEDPPGPPPKVRLAAIEYIAYSIFNGWTPQNDVVANGAASAPQVVNNLESIDIAIRFVEPIELRPWLDANLRPNLVEVVADGVTYFTSPEDKPGDMFVAQRDARTVVLATSPERLVALVKGQGKTSREATAAAGFADQWASVDGGLATVALNVEGMAPREIQVDGNDPLAQLALGFLGINVAEGEPNPVVYAVRTIGNSTKTMCLGLDVDATTSDFVLRSSLACGDLDGAKRVRESVELLKNVAKAYLQAMAGAGVPQMNDVESQMYVDAMLLGYRMFGESALDFRLRGEDRVDVWVEARGAMPASFARGIAAWAAMGDSQVQPAAAEGPVEVPTDAGQKPDAAVVPADAAAGH